MATVNDYIIVAMWGYNALWGSVTGLGLSVLNWDGDHLKCLGVKGNVIQGIGQGGEGQIQVWTEDGYLHVYNIE